ncbi:uncharacterized protein LOC123410268 [Hordeum vulgare subsp. vulgare]|uniref:uncharacterized protein LOC123410268 n=1 Tax=Hordeum vulgare subsp. vulgare TaxID=112509 RepID=UPI001B85799D|nr:uncharacterized protein LOC123410268 [Hordeum vulgare subsp. vulgare]KAI4976773.1 hypothetical protein ZWY2020_050380 [Hordeum vulgare]
MPSSPAPSPVIDISDTESGDDAAAAASSALSTSAVERIASTLTTQAKVDAVCRNHDVPTEFAARPAGELRACSEPPRGSVCVYAHMLETGVRFPLHDFFCDALTHFHLAPGQLSINGWRVLVGFVALCHEAGMVPPSMALLRHFFQLYNRNDWYYFRCRADAGVLFTGTSYAQSEREWKGGFFFLTSQESWRCPVRWGKPPYKSSAAGPVLTTYQKQSAEKLLRVHGAARDLRAYLRETDLSAALSANLAGAPPPPQPSPRSTVAEVVDPPVRDMTHSMPVENTAAPAAWTEQVKSEAHGDTHPLAGKKRRREEVTGADGLGCAAPVACPRSPHSPVPETHDGDSADWKAARKVLEGIVTPWRERHFAASKPSNLLASSYVAVLQAANYATFSMTYALEREEKVLARERDNLALWEQVEKEKAARQAVEAELEKFLRSGEYTRLLAEQALTGYLRGAEEMKRVVLQHYPHLDAGKLELPVD